MPNAPTSRAIQLADGQVDPPALVPAMIIRDLPSSRLNEIEQAWRPAREQAAQVFARANASAEHGHWDWRNKVWSTESGRHRVIAIECGGDVQGLMAVLTQSRPAMQGTGGGPTLYVDYIETAPWNLKGKPTRPRFLGVGTMLIAEAVNLSLDLGWQGRVGLHSLPQADSFYGTFCQMTSLGPDPSYHSLTYFEYTEEEAAKWLSSLEH